ncbi:ARM repeat-containing protein [Guyanagaster necrorhizus]|uniref:ARM repeat-containing protein n=1 Tax=Guyanagaster necrorhizus TaxID=856835 RepID=A0A9P7VF16_9AGAR|nr:ARM repeat-containing protein [Guyanagaster necrorhizus MCA 3950]KAG7439377.1 ARM repeat-containing protein [Guyanagaster necrorhizus MCA 3950]
MSATSLDFLPPPSTSPLRMPTADSAQTFLAVHDLSAPPHNGARPRQPSGPPPMSIWAPQPQPSESTWPKTLDSFSRVVEKDNHQQPLGSKQVSSQIRSPPSAWSTATTKELGAIGDGRKKNSPSSDFDDAHVEQLLRTLDLNSPDPFAHQKPTLNLSSETTPGSPYFSPASVSSALLTPTDLSPTRSFDVKQCQSPYELTTGPRSGSYFPPASLLFEPSSPTRLHHISDTGALSHSPTFSSAQMPITGLPYLHAPTQLHSLPYYLKSYDHHAAAAVGNIAPQPSYSIYQASPIDQIPSHLFNSQQAPVSHRQETAPNVCISRGPLNSGDWNIPRAPVQSTQQNFSAHSEWIRSDEKPMVNALGISSGGVGIEEHSSGLRSSFSYQQSSSSSPQRQLAHEPINFLSLLHPSSTPPYHSFVSRIIKASDQQASIFLQQKLKVADVNERAKIVDAICARGFEMMAHRFGNWAVQRCLEAASTADEKRKIVGCMKGRIVELATNCYGCHVLQKALDCEEDIRLAIVSELLLGDPAQTLVNKHASHVWSKVMELSWTPPAPPIFAFVNKSLKGNWAALACHETGSLVVQHAFENLEDAAKDGIVDEILNQGPSVFGDVAKSQWGSYCIQHILEHGSDKHRQLTLDHLVSGLLEYATNEQGYKSVTKGLKEGGKDTLGKVVKRMCEPAKGYDFFRLEVLMFISYSARRAMIVDLALSVTGSQLIASVLPMADKDQRALLYDCIRSHIVTLRGCKTGSKVIWLFDRMRAYYGY